MTIFSSYIHRYSSYTKHFLHRLRRWLWLSFSMISTVVAISGSIDPASESMHKDLFLTAVQAGDKNALERLCLNKTPDFNESGQNSPSKIAEGYLVGDG